MIISAGENIYPAEVERALSAHPQVREVALGPNGLIEAMGEGSLHIDMSTIAPSAAIEVSIALAGVGAHAVDAPVSGGEAGAVNRPGHGVTFWIRIPR